MEFMITYWILQLFAGIISGVLGLVKFSVNSLPLHFGDYLHTGAGYLYYLVIYFPPLGIILNGFLVYMGFRGSMILLYLFRVLKHTRVQ